MKIILDDNKKKYIDLYEKIVEQINNNELKPNE